MREKVPKVCKKYLGQSVVEKERVKQWKKKI